jgi:hypothetical protein
LAEFRVKDGKELDYEELMEENKKMKQLLNTIIANFKRKQIKEGLKGLTINLLDID